MSSLSFSRHPNSKLTKTLIFVTWMPLRLNYAKTCLSVVLSIRELSLCKNAPFLSTWHFCTWILQKRAFFALLATLWRNLFLVVAMIQNCILLDVAWNWAMNGHWTCWTALVPLGVLVCTTSSLGHSDSSLWPSSSHLQANVVHCLQKKVRSPKCCILGCVVRAQHYLCWRFDNLTWYFCSNYPYAK